MGIAIIINGADFSAKNLGKVNIIQDVDVESMSIMGDNSYEAASFQLGVSYLPLNTNQKGVTWEITSGGQYATIDAVSGVVTILEGANNNNIVVKATNTYKPSVTATKTISVKYKATLDVLNSISVIGDSTINDETHQFAVEFDPANTSYNSVTWAITNGSQYASINQDGLLSVVEGTANKSVTIRATSTHDTSIYGEKTAVVTYAIPPIQFADPAVKAFWVSKADSDGDGEVSKAEAAAKTGAMPQNFCVGLTADSMDEFQYFGYSSISFKSFDSCNIGHITLPKSITAIAEAGFQSCEFGTLDFNGCAASAQLKYLKSANRVVGTENLTLFSTGGWGSGVEKTIEYISPLENVTSYAAAALRGLTTPSLCFGNGANSVTFAGSVLDSAKITKYIIFNVTEITTGSSFSTLKNNGGVAYVKDEYFDSISAVLTENGLTSANIKALSQFATDFPEETETINWLNKFSA